MSRQLRDIFCDSFACAPRDFGPLPGLTVGSKSVIVIHPLWDRGQPTGRLAEAVASLPPDASLGFLDTFNMIRRPSHAYESLQV